MKKLSIRSIRNADAFIPVRFILLMVIVIGIIIGTYVTMVFEPNSCSHCPGMNTKMINGTLKGFSVHPTLKDYVNVKIGNDTYVFDLWHTRYMTPMLGNSVTVKCCAMSNNDFKTYYDFMEAWINTDID